MGNLDIPHTRRAQRMTQHLDRFRRVLTPVIGDDHQESVHQCGPEGDLLEGVALLEQVDRLEHAGC